MPTMHLYPLTPERFECVIQPDGMTLEAAQAVALTRAKVTIPADAVGSLISHPSFRIRFKDCIIHRVVRGSL